LKPDKVPALEVMSELFLNLEEDISSKEFLGQSRSLPFSLDIAH